MLGDFIMNPLGDDDGYDEEPGENESGYPDYLEDLLSTNAAFANTLQQMADGLSKNRLTQIFTGLSIRIAACIHNQNPIEAYYWSILVADLIQATIIKDSVDLEGIENFINDEQFDYLLRQFTDVNEENESEEETKPE